MADPVIITVAKAGTPEAATANFVCDGVNDEVEINAAIEAAAAAGGGAVRIAAGDYSTSFPIIVYADGVSLEGAAGGGTTITPAADWLGAVGPEGADVTGVVCFVGVDNFAARNLTIEAGTTIHNGLIAIPTGFNGAGEPCTNGVFEGNVVRINQGHAYAIWSQRSENIDIIDNHVDGGSTAALAHSSQEGIEIYGGHNVLISGNVITGIGNAAISLGNAASVTPDCSVENVVVTGNVVSNSRIGLYVGTSWGVEGPGHARDILVEGNDFEGLFECGFTIRNVSGDPDTPPEASNIVFRDNDVGLSFSPTAGFSPSGVWFFNDTPAGYTSFSGILVEENRFTTTEVAALPALAYLGPNWQPFISLQQFAGVEILNNLLSIEASGISSRGIMAYDSSDFTIAGNAIAGAGLIAIEIYNGERFLIEANLISDWGTDQFAPAILVGFGRDYSIIGNTFLESLADPGNFITLFDSDPPASLAGNIRIVNESATIAGSLIENLELGGTAVAGIGNDLANVIAGNDLANLLDGGAGDDRLSGGAGDDHYLVDSALDEVIELADEGVDLVTTSASYVLAEGMSVEVLEAASGLAAIDLTGNDLANVLLGNAGDNVLNGGGGADILIGYGGDDTYIVDDPSVQVIESSGGNDRLLTSVSYFLPISSYVRTMEAAAGTAPIMLFGSFVDNILVGNDGNNVLHGGAGGNDILIGGKGDDVYYMDVPQTSIVEAVGEGNDALYTSVSYALGGDAEVETLSTSAHAGTSAINLTGNYLNNLIQGNNGANVLHGAGGIDVLVGFGGNDVYYTDVAGTQVLENIGGGNDVVYTSVSYALAAGSEVETLSTNSHAATVAINLTGNALDNVLVGNAGNNVLHGAGGADILVGREGNDVYYTDVAATQVLEAAGGGNDALYTSVSYALAAGSEIELLSTNSHAATFAIDLTGNSFANILFGNAGANVLDGKGGNDLLVGLAGADTFAFSSALGAGNVDAIAMFEAGVDRIALDDAIFAGLGLGALDPGAFALGPAALDANDRVIFDSATGQLFYDADGNGAGAALQFATIQSGSLTASDFTII